MTVIDRLVDIVTVEPLDGFKARIEFEDGVQKVIDLEKYLDGPIFEPMRRDPVFFRSMFIADGAITWPNEADIDSEVLYYDLIPVGMEDHPEFKVITNGGENLSISWDSLVDVISKLNVSDKAALLTMLSDQIATTVARLEAEKRDLVLAVREAQAPYKTSSKE